MVDQLSSVAELNKNFFKYYLINFKIRDIIVVAILDFELIILVAVHVCFIVIYFRTQKLF